MPRIDPATSGSDILLLESREQPPTQGWIASLCLRVHNFFCCVKKEVFKAQFPRILDPELAMAKMRANTMRAAREQRHQPDHALFERSPVAHLDTSLKVHELKFSVQTAQNACNYHPMQDAHFVQEVAGGILAGVFDGHGGEGLSTYLAEEVKANFPFRLDEHLGNVHAAIEALFSEIQGSVLKIQSFKRQGSTAVVVYVDKGTHLVYTATLGDSVANIYRGKRSVALSPLRDWSSPHDAQRAADALAEPWIATQWRHAVDPKSLRFPSAQKGVNVSRSFGEGALLADYPGAISHKPKISVFQARPGDLLTLVSDGVSDYVNERWPIYYYENNKATFAESLARRTEQDSMGRRGDDITVIAIEISV